MDMVGYRVNCNTCYKSMRIGSLFATPRCSTCSDKEKKRVAKQMDDNITIWAKVANPDVNDIGSVLDESVRFCSVHGIVHENGFANLKDCNCPCAENSAPSKTIRQTNIHFGVKSKSKGWFMGCTLAPKGPQIDKLRDAGERVNVTNHLSHVTCRQCAKRLRRAIAKQD
jgi:hypothetical protein